MLQEIHLRRGKIPKAVTHVGDLLVFRLVRNDFELMHELECELTGKEVMRGRRHAKGEEFPLRVVVVSIMHACSVSLVSETQRIYPTALCPRCIPSDRDPIRDASTGPRSHAVANRAGATTRLTARCDVVEIPQALW